VVRIRGPTLDQMVAVRTYEIAGMLSSLEQSSKGLKEMRIAS
jgi:hypothetical protein